MPHPLPDSPDLEKLKADAKLLRDVRRADDPTVKLADAQRELARHYGFPSWPKLRAHVLLVNHLTRRPHRVALGGGDPAGELLTLGCLNYGADDAVRTAAGRALLAEHPELASASIWTAAACGDVDGVVRFVGAQPSSVDTEGGPFGWPPLLYLTYSRLGAGDPLGVARVLLEHGADPNAGYLWDGLPSPFTALTGVYGGGEQGAPPHPDELALAELLLEAGADANDNQTIYNRGIGQGWADDTAYLEQLLRFGLGRGDGGPWKRRLGPALPTPAELLGEALQGAAEHGCVERVRVLLAGGADPNGRGQHPLFRGRTAIEGAVRNGQRAVVDLLVDAGGDLTTVDPVEVDLGRLLAGERVADAAAALEREPHLVARAVEQERPPAVLRTLVALGWEVNHRARNTALHEAAWRGDLDTIRTLLDLGADPTIEDTEFHATPRGWAEHNGQAEAMELLA